MASKVELLVNSSIVKCKEFEESNLTITIRCLEEDNCLREQKIFFEIEPEYYINLYWDQEDRDLATGNWTNVVPIGDIGTQGVEKTLFFTPELLGFYKLRFYVEKDGSKHYFGNGR